MTRRGLLALALGGFAAGAVAQEANYAPIPPLRAERVPPPPPGPRVVWEPGHWHWNGNRYVWVAGRYIPAHRYTRWVHGEWVHRHGRWVWVPGHWV